MVGVDVFEMRFKGKRVGSWRKEIRGLTGDLEKEKH